MTIDDLQHRESQKGFFGAEPPPILYDEDTKSLIFLMRSLLMAISFIFRSERRADLKQNPEPSPSVIALLLI